MAKKITITQNDINRVCIAIVATGEIPTLALVRKRLGNRGSFATIQPFLKAWKDDNKENSDLPPVPEKLEEIGMQAIYECWKIAVRINQKDIANLKSLHSQEISDLNLQLQENLVMLDNMATETEQANNEIVVLRVEIKRLEAEVSRTLGRIDEMKKIL